MARKSREKFRFSL